MPAIAYGGPDVPPDLPSPDSVKLAESLILDEFVADLHPTSPLLPKDPVVRAKARFFIDAISNKFSPGWAAFLIRGEKAEQLFKGLEAIQLLLPDNYTYAVSDDFTIADAAIAPFLARLEVALKNDIGAYKEGEGKKAWEVYHSDRFAILRKYFEIIKARPSFQATFDEVSIRYTAELAVQTYMCFQLGICYWRVH